MLGTLPFSKLGVGGRQEPNQFCSSVLRLPPTNSNRNLPSSDRNAHSQLPSPPRLPKSSQPPPPLPLCQERLHVDIEDAVAFARASHAPVMARPFQKIGHGLDRFSFRRRRSASSSSPLSLASDGTDSGSHMEGPPPAAPSTRRILSRSCGSKGSRLSVDLPPPLAGGPSDKAAAGSSLAAAVPPRPVRHEGPPSDGEMVKEKFSKLLLGEDMSGTGKGVSSALALSNAITNLAGVLSRDDIFSASVFGEQRRLQPMAADQKARWMKEIDWLLSVADHIVEFVPSQQWYIPLLQLNCLELTPLPVKQIMVTQQRQDLQMNIPALCKLDAMLLEYLESFKDKQEFWYVSKDADKSEKGNMPRQDDKWWLPTVKVPPNGLSDAYRKWLQHQKDLVAQVLKAAMAINANILMEMEVPESYMESLPKYFDYSHNLHISPLHFFFQDVGLAILESYSRTLESLAFTVMSRLEDILNADLATQDPKNADSMRMPSLTSDDTDQVVSDAKAEVEKLRRMEPVTSTLFDLVGPRDQDLSTYANEGANGPKLTKISSIATKRFSYLDNLGGTRSPIARH
ncbi:Rop guanine nucleotide exchange factor 9 [Dichanthelium oligosanthes]|uniref:Rop guanine nucleotide exchange factor 9 n=1 Tax=Dichanthelium oligosanthes TaxID=888268 RepID=A0A1E5VSY1_9POAL|nr:Rop guanine nucleotide exchange factor 9 [Dichanthelium oligosanthes]